MTFYGSPLNAMMGKEDVRYSYLGLKDFKGTFFRG